MIDPKSLFHYSKVICSNDLLKKINLTNNVNLTEVNLTNCRKIIGVK